MHPEDLEYARRLLAAWFPITRLLAAEVRRHGQASNLTLSQFVTLGALSERDCLANELAKRFSIAMPTVTQRVESLASKGLLERRDDPSDRRLVWLHLTEKGRRIFHHCRERLEERLAEVLASLPQEEKATLVRSLEALKTTSTTPIQMASWNARTSASSG